MALAIRSRPVLLCLDDLHWADSATLDWLAFLGRRLPNSQLLVIATHRSEDADAIKDLPLPDTVRDAIEARAERLSLMARQVLEAGAVLGQAFVFEEVEHIQSGQCWTFSTLDETLGFLRQQANDQKVLGRSADECAPLPYPGEKRVKSYT